MVIFFSVCAQSAQQMQARAAFEEAEQLYENSQHAEAYNKLNETETLLGSTNPRIVYLRVLTLNSLLHADPKSDFEIVELLRAYSDQYLNQFQRTSIPPEKIAEVTRIYQEVYSKYPATRAEFESQREAANRSKRAPLIAEIKQRIDLSNCIDREVQTFKSIKRDIFLRRTTFDCTDNGDVTILVETQDMERKKKLLKTVRKTITFNIRDIDRVYTNKRKYDQYDDISEGAVGFVSKAKKITVRNEIIMDQKAWGKDFAAERTTDKTSNEESAGFYYCPTDGLGDLLIKLRDLW